MPIDALALRGCSSTSNPHIDARPDVLLTSPARMLISVDLPRAVRAQQPEDRPARNVEADAIQRAFAARIGLAQTIDLDRRLGHASGLRRIAGAGKHLSLFARGGQDQRRRTWRWRVDDGHGGRAQAIRDARRGAQLREGAVRDRPAGRNDDRPRDLSARLALVGRRRRGGRRGELPCRARRAGALGMRDRSDGRRRCRRDAPRRPVSCAAGA